MSQPPTEMTPVRPVSQGRPPERPSGRVGGPGGPQRPRTTRSAPPPPPQRQDPFPYIMGGIIGALVVGLILVVFLLVNNNQSPTVTNTGSNPNSAPNSAPNSLPTTDPASVAAEPTAELAPRMTMDEFKALYDDPARRPVVVDVRAAEAFQQGHIQGAINIPEAEVGIRLAEFPKDKLIVAYCQ